MMSPDEKIIQIASRAEGDTTFAVLYALTDKGNIYSRCDGEWERVELPNEQEARLQEEASKPAKKGWFR